MTEEELREKIAWIIIEYGYIAEVKADQILTLIRKAGYRSLEEFVRCPVCGEEYSAKQLMECVDDDDEET